MRDMGKSLLIKREAWERMVYEGTITAAGAAIVLGKALAA